MLTFVIYLPSVFRGEIVKCVLNSDGTLVYQKRDNEEFLDTIFYSVTILYFANLFNFNYLITLTFFLDLQSYIRNILQISADRSDCRT